MPTKTQSGRKANVGLSEEQCRKVVEMLNQALADEFVLYTRTRNYHWNVTGRQFNDLHKFFETQYGELEEKVDEIAEFIRYFGEKVPTSLGTFRDNARLKDDADAPASEQMIERLLSDHEEVIRNLREHADAADENEAIDAADFFTGLLEQHEKMAWMLRSMLE